MKFSWFKLHSGIRNDSKLKRMPVQQRYAFIVLLCLASESEVRGTILNLDDEDFAFEVEMQLEDWQTLKAKFRVKGLVEFDSSSLTICNWDNMQYDKPSDRAEETRRRKQEQRARDAAKRAIEDSVVTQDVTLVTPLSQDVTPNVTQIRLEEIRSEEIRSDLHTNIASAVEIQKTSDRISRMKQSEQDKWTHLNFDCRALSKDEDFAQYIRTVYLPSVPEYRGKEIEISTAKTWIVKGQRDPARRDLVEIQLEAMRSLQQKTKLQTPCNDRLRLSTPHPQTWTSEQMNWSTKQWQDFLYANLSENQSNASQHKSNYRQANHSAS